MTTILFVCTGNTCRSPLAAGLAGVLARRHGLQVCAMSAGTLAADGAPASTNSRTVGRERGVDLTGHRSRPVTAELIAGADIVVGMSPAHVEAVRRGTRDSVNVAVATDYLPADHPWHGRPIPDPFGEDLAMYEEVADVLEACVESILDGIEIRS